MDKETIKVWHSRSNNKGGTKGFTLIELMIVVVIIAILSAVAFPSYLAQVRKGHRTDMQATLIGAAQQMERAYTLGRAYDCNDLDDLDTERYAVTCASPSGDQTFQITATPQGDQTSDSCGTMTIDQTGATTAAESDCWE